MIENVETAGGLNQAYQQAKTARSPFEPDWMLNRAFFAGIQWVAWQSGRVSRPRLDPNRQYVTDNRIKPVVTSRVARKAKNRPMFSATPQGGDDKAMDAARIGERILENDWEELALQPKLFTTLLWADICCDGFIKVFWDSTKGARADVLVDSNGQPIQGPTGLLKAEDAMGLPPEMLEQIAGVKPVSQGDVACEVLSPFELYPSPLATSMEDCEWMVEEKIRSIDYVREHYPEDANGHPFEPVADASVPGGLSEGLISSYMGMGQLYAGSASALAEGVRVREYRCLPGRRYPDGYMATWVNDTVVVRDDQPYDPMPYVKFGSVEIPGRFWSGAVTTDLREPQIDLNTIRTQIKENARRVGNPALLESRQANVRYQGIPGEVIQYDSTVQDAVPSYLEPPQIPVYLENEVGRIEKSIEEISGMHEVSRATVPTGVTAASAINLLQEADETRIGPEIQQMEFALGKWGTKILKLRARFNTDERIIRIAGDDGNWDVFAFKGEMLGEDPHVEVQAGSQMPRSKAAKQAAMTEVLGLIVQYGVPVDERNLRRFLKNYEVGGLDLLFEGMTEDAKQVNRENRQLIQLPEAIPINTWDNHEFHVGEHTEFMKSNRFFSLPPDAKQRFEDHVAFHREYMVGVINRQVTEQSQEQAAGMEEQASLEQETDITKEAAKAAFTIQPEGDNHAGST